MPENRQLPLQVIPQSGQSSPNTFYNMTTEHLVNQLQGLLNTSGQNIVSMVNDVTQQASVDQHSLLAAANLDQATKDMGVKTDLYSVQAATDANNQAAQVTASNMAAANDSLGRILQQSQRGLIATVAQSTPEQLQNMVNSGEAQNLDPRGYLKLEESIGTRLAMNDTTKALALIHGSGTVPPIEDIVNGLADQASLNSPVARGAYLSSLTNDIERYRNGEMLNQMDQERVNATQSLITRFTRDISLGVGDYSLTPDKFVARVGKLGQDFAELNPRTANSQNVLEFQTKALSDIVNNSVLNRMTPERLIPFAAGVSQMVSNDPNYAPLFNTVVGDLQQESKYAQTKWTDNLGNLVSTAENATGLLNARIAIVNAAVDGHITPQNAAALNQQLLQRQYTKRLDLNAEARIMGALGLPGDPLPDTPEQDTAIDGAVRKYMSDNPMPINGQPGAGTRAWTLPEQTSFTLQKTGRLTRGLLDAINTQAAIKLDDKSSPSDVQAWTAAVSSVDAAMQTNPIYTRDLIASGRVDPRMGLAATLASDMPAGAYPISSTAEKLANIDESKLREGLAIVNGGSYFEQHPPQGGIANVNAAINSVGDLKSVVAGAMQSQTRGASNLWFPFAADVVPQRAINAFKALFVNDYAIARSSGVDIATATTTAKTNAAKETVGGYFPADLGADAKRYIIGNDSPLAVISNGAFDPTNTAKNINNFNYLWKAAESVATGSLWQHNVVKEPMFPGGVFYTSPVSLDFDRAERVISPTTGNPVLRVPIIVNKGLGPQQTDSTKPADWFIYPLNPVDLKAELDKTKADLAKDAEPNIFATP